MKKSLFFMISILFVFVGYTQGTRKIAFREYKGMRYANAASYLIPYVKKHTDDVEAKKTLADCYYKLKDTENAEKIYSELYTNHSTDTAVSYPYAMVLLEEGKSDKALEVFKKLKAVPSYEKIANSYIKSINNTANLYKDSSNVHLYNLNINTQNAEFSPVLYNDKLVFTTARTRNYGKIKVFGWNNTPYLQVYSIDTSKIVKTNEVGGEGNTYDFVEASDGKHSDETVLVPNDSKTLGYYGDYIHVSKDTKKKDSASAEPFSGIVNTKYHDGPAVFTKDGNTMFFTRNNYKKGIRGKDKNKVTKLKLFYVTKENGVWSTPKEVPFNNKEYSTGHPALSLDDKTLYFVSDMPGGQGETDIYKVSYDNGNFGTPENLGSTVNTPSKEMFPTIDGKGNLIFSSNGHGGLGGLDLFASDVKKLDKVENLGYPLNSINDDFGITFTSNKSGYLSTNRKSGGYDDDILAFGLKKPISLGKEIKIIAYDELTGEELNAVDIKVNELNISTNTADKTEYTFSADEDKLYHFALTKSQYFPVSSKVMFPHNSNEDSFTYRVPMLKNLVPTLEALVTDKETKQPIEAVKLKIVDLKTKKTLFEGLTSESGTISKILDGKKLKDTLHLSITIHKDGYLGKTVHYNNTIKTPIVKLHEMLDMRIEKMQVGLDIGKVIEINPIYFDLDKYNIRPDAAVELDKIVTVMKENPTIVIELGSHTDCRSSKAYNMKLSTNRAKASADYIISKGVPKSRIYGKGYGESKLVNNCACEMPVKSTCSEAEHQQNRRTEFVIVKM